MSDDSRHTTRAVQLPRHGEILAVLARAVDDTDECRWLVLGCSLGRGTGDELSDIDAGIGYAEPLAVDELERIGSGIVKSAGDVIDVLVHQLDGWPDDSRRFAAEYANGVQLDLVLVPASRRTGTTAGEEQVIIDKDGNLAGELVSRHQGPPDERLAREWVMLGWWAVSDIAKYLQRGSLFEAAARIETAREQALRLSASATGVAYPAYGLTSLLDYPRFELPDGLASTYCNPADRASVGQAGTAVADLLAESASRAAEALGYDLSTPWATSARARLIAASKAARA